MEFNITDSAAKKINDLIASTAEPDEKLCLRIHIQGGGCSGFQYCFAFDDIDAKDAYDWQFQQHGSTVIIDQLSMPYLAGATLDYVKNISEEKFVINNPNASGSCGCGKSFSA